MKEMKARSVIVVTLAFLMLMSVVTPGLVQAEDVDTEENDYIAQAPIRIDGNSNFAAQAAAEGWPGDGSEGNPYVIEGYEIDGTGYGYGIYVGNTTVHFVVRGCYVHNASGHLYGRYYHRDAGIYLNNVQKGILEDNIARSNGHGILLWNSSRTMVDNNTVSENEAHSVYISSSTNIVLTNNNLENDSISIFGWEFKYWNTHEIDTTNTINGKPVYYLKDVKGGTVPEDAGQVILVNCEDVRVDNQKISNTRFSISLAFSNNNTIINNSIRNNKYGIELYWSNDNAISSNHISVYGRGIYLHYSQGNIITNNIIQNETVYRGSYGILVLRSNHNIIAGNNISGFEIGIGLDTSYDFEVYNNTFTNNYVDIDEQYDIENGDGWLPSIGFSLSIILILTVALIVCKNNKNKRRNRYE